MSALHKLHSRLIGFSLALGLGFATAMPAQAVPIVLNNVDESGLGLNDLTPATPVGGNSGTTVGAQRLGVFHEAARLWGDILGGDVPVVIQSSFIPLGCNANSGVLGAAGTITVWAGFPGAEHDNTWYPAALANQLAGEDLSPGDPDPGFLAEPYNDDIIAVFNSELGTTGCLEGAHWYYGLDNNPGAGGIDFLNVVMHEIAHGLGFSSFVDETTGEGFLDLPGVYDTLILDRSTGMFWTEMNNDERMASAINSGNVVWGGLSVNALAAGVLQRGVPELTIDSFGQPLSIGTASFGPPVPPEGISGVIVLAEDGENETNDGCSPLVNAADIAGNIALIDRGACFFTDKTLNAQAAGATAVIIANNQDSGAINLGGAADGITIPTVSVSMADGDAIKAALPGAQGTLSVNFNLLAGASPEGLVKLYAPNPVQPGSSISHFDNSATPNLLMEPSITSTLRASETVDLTGMLLADLGWDIQDIDQYYDLIVAQCQPYAVQPFFGLSCFQQTATALLQGGAISAATYRELIYKAVNYKP